MLREALLREHYRGGQSFFVVPRIADLPDIEEFLREQVPEIKSVIAHGQMSPTEVEERMSAFYDRNTTCCSPPRSSKAGSTFRAPTR